MQSIEENYEHRYRIDLMRHEYNALVTLIEDAKKSDTYINDNILEKFENYKVIKISYAKLDAIAKASQTCSKKAKEKFESAVVELLCQESELTPYKIAKRAGISFVTAKKYLKQLNED